MMKFLKFKPEDYVTRLPVAYYTGNLNMELSKNIWNFEVNALPEDINCMLYIKFVKGIDSAEIRINDNAFVKVLIKDQSGEIPVSINNRILSFDIRLNEKTACRSCPLTEISLNVPGSSESCLLDFPGCRRETKMENCNLLNNWNTSYGKIMTEDFDLEEITKMRDEIVSWISGRQVLNVDDPHYGAIYSEEDKYCFRDAIFATACFMKKYLQTQDKTWLDRAVAARDYSFKGQYRNTGNIGKDGAWAAMGIIDDPAGKNFRRITDEWAQASGVDTSIIGIIAGELYDMGLPFNESQLEQLESAVVWNMRNKIERGWFSHHEGMTLTCINVNTLAASMIYSVNKILIASGRHGLDKEIMAEANLSVQNVLQCQEAIGVFPYRRGDSRRGGKYSCENLPDNGMTLQALMYMLKNKDSRVFRNEVSNYLRKNALWYLLCSRWDGGRLVLEYRTDDEYLKGVAFGNFTWCRIMMMDVISQEWDHIGNTPFWKQFIRCHLRTLRETLWNNTDTSRAPVKSSVVPIRLVSWIQQAEWTAWVLDNLATRYNTIDTAF